MAHCTLHCGCGWKDDTRGLELERTVETFAQLPSVGICSGM
jgi:hypothetical protein